MNPHAQTIANLMQAKEQVQLELGWACLDWLKEEAKVGRADMGRAALSYAIHTLAETYQDCFSSEKSAEMNIALWMRVAGHFTRERVAELRGNFTFHHLRACLFETGGDPAKIEENVQLNLKYAQENDGKWMPVNGKREDVDLIVRAQRACQRCIDAGEGSDLFRDICLQIVNYQKGWTE